MNNSPLIQRAALENIQVVLKAAGSGLKHVVKVNIYLANMPRDFQPMNEIYLQVGSDFYYLIIMSF